MKCNTGGRDGRGAGGGAGGEFCSMLHSDIVVGCVLTFDPVEVSGASNVEDISWPIYRSFVCRPDV